MEWGGRSTSLVDLSQRPGTSREWRPTHHQSLADVRDSTPLLAEELLDHGSPGSVGSGDPTLLDIDSDNADDVETKTDTTVNMETDTQCTTVMTGDPLYHQCKTARRSSFTERLVSVSGDSTFGSSVTSI
jgi:hypothetical protein